MIVSIHQTNHHRITQFQHPAVTLLATVPTAAQPHTLLHQHAARLPVLTGSPCLHMWRPGYRSIMIMEHPGKVIRSWSQSLLASGTCPGGGAAWITCNSTCQHEDNVLTITILWYTYILGLPFFSVLMSSAECSCDFWIGPHWLTGFWQNPYYTAYRWQVLVYLPILIRNQWKCHILAASWFSSSHLPKAKKCQRIQKSGQISHYQCSEEWGSDQSTIITCSVMFSWHIISDI